MSNFNEWMSYVNDATAKEDEQRRKAKKNTGVGGFKTFERDQPRPTPKKAGIGKTVATSAGLSLLKGGAQVGALAEDLLMGPYDILAKGEPAFNRSRNFEQTWDTTVDPLKEQLGTKDSTLGEVIEGIGSLIPSIAISGGITKATGYAPMVKELGEQAAEKLGGKVLGKGAQKAVQSSPDMLNTWLMTEAAKPAEERTSLPVWAAEWVAGDAALGLAGKGLAKAGTALKGKLGKGAKVEPAIKEPDLLLDDLGELDEMLNPTIADFTVEPTGRTHIGEPQAELPAGKQPLAIEGRKPLALEAGEQPLALEEGKIPNWDYYKPTRFQATSDGKVMDMEEGSFPPARIEGRDYASDMGLKGKQRLFTDTDQPIPRSDIGDPEYLASLEKRYGELVDEEVNNIKGDIQGVLKLGNADDGYYRASLNPSWYRDFWQKNGRTPNAGEWRSIAIRNLLEGDPSRDMPANDEFRQILSELSRGQKLPDEWHGLQKSLSEISGNSELKGLADEMQSAQKETEPYGIEQDMGRLNDVENGIRSKTNMKDEMDFGQEYPAENGVAKFKYASSTAKKATNDANRAFEIDAKDPDRITYDESAFDREDIQLADKVANALSGTSVVPAKMPSFMEKVQGFFDPNSKKIFLNSKMDDPATYVTLHETTHRMQVNFPEQYAKMQEIAVNNLKDDHKALIERYQKRGYEITDMPDEYFSDLMAEMLHDKSFVGKLRDNAPEVIQPLLQVIDEVIQKVKLALSKDDSVLPFIENLERLRSELAPEYQGYLDTMATQQSKGIRKGWQTPEGIAAKQGLGKGATKNTGNDILNSTTTKLGDTQTMATPYEISNKAEKYSNEQLRSILDQAQARGIPVYEAEITANGAPDHVTRLTERMGLLASVRKTLSHYSPIEAQKQSLAFDLNVQPKAKGQVIDSSQQILKKQVDGLIPEYQAKYEAYIADPRNDELSNEFKKTAQKLEMLLEEGKQHPDPLLYNLDNWEYYSKILDSSRSRKAIPDVLGKGATKAELTDPALMGYDNFIKASDYNKQLRGNYFDENGNKLASSRNTPANLPDIPIGSWKIDDRFNGKYGHEIEQLRMLDPNSLVESEGNVVPNVQGRGDDAVRYAQWIKEGKNIPPISVVEMENGGYKVVDGHRRLLAAKQAGVDIPAWVSPAVETGQIDSMGRPIKTGLTWELAQKQITTNPDIRFKMASSEQPSSLQRIADITSDVAGRIPQGLTLDDFTKEITAQYPNIGKAVPYIWQQAKKLADTGRAEVSYRGESIPLGKELGRGATTPISPVGAKGKAVQPEFGQGSGIMNESQFKTNTLTNSEFLQEPEIQKVVQDAEMLYETKPNEQSIQRANDMVQNDFWGTVDRISQKGLQGAEDAVASGIITNAMRKEAQTTGDYAQLTDWLKTVQPKVTDVAQTLQALSTWKSMTVEGALNMAARVTNTADKVIKDANKFTGKKVELTPDDVKYITEQMSIVEQMPEGTEAEMRAKEIEFAKVKKYIADKVPSTLAEKIKALQRIAMLLNPKTIVSRNTLGNTILGGFETLKDVPGTLADMAISKVTGQRTTLMPSTEGFKTLGKGAKKGFEQVTEDIKAGVDTSPTRGQYELPSHRIFENPVLNGLDQATTRALQYGDRPFFQAAYDETLRQQMKIAGVDAPTDAMKEMAMDVAKDRTFQNDSIIAKGVEGLRSDINRIGAGILHVGSEEFGIGNIVLPFSKTPSNIIDKAVDYSPVGFIRAGVEATKLNKGTFDQKKFVDIVGRSVVGTGIIMLGYDLAKKGILTGDVDKDADVRAMKQSVGINPYSFNTNAAIRLFTGEDASPRKGDVWQTWEWAQPISVALAIGADIFKAGKERKEASNMLYEGIKSGGNTLLKQSVLQGVQKMVGGYDVMEGLLDTVFESPLQLIPSIFGQGARTADDKARETYDPSKFQAIVNKGKTKIPFARNTMYEKVDAMGNVPSSVYGGNTIFNTYFNPGTTQEYNPSPAQEMVMDIYNKTGETIQFPRVVFKTISGKALTPKQLHDYQLYVGQRTANEFNLLANDSYFRNLDPTEQANELKKVLDDVSTEAKEEVLKIEPKGKGKSYPAYSPW